MIPPPSLTRMLNNFEELGFVTRKSDSRDQRKTLVNLTSAGWKKFEQVAPEAEEIYFTIEKKVGKRELNEVLKKLQKLNANLRIEY